MRTPKTVLAAILLAATLPLAACALVPPPEAPPGNIETADGPADELPTVEGEPDEPAEPAQVPSFHQKYTYDDGVEVEITKIDKGRLTRQQAEDEFEDGVKPGMGWVRFTARIRNGAKKTLDASLVYASVTYGKDGREAPNLYFNDDSDFDGKILPGRAKTAEATYLIPEKFWGDVVLEFTIGDDFERESVIFAGSVK